MKILVRSVSVHFSSSRLLSIVCFTAAENIIKTEVEKCLCSSDQDVPCVGNEGAVSGSQCRNQLPRRSTNEQHSVTNKWLPNGNATPEVEVARVKTERQLSDFPTICTLLENQTDVTTRVLVEGLMHDVLQQDTRHLHSSHSESDVTNGPFLGGYTNIANDLCDVPQFTEEPGRYASLVIHPGRRLQTPVDANCDSCNTISDSADFIDSVVEVKLKGDTGVGDDHQLTGSDTLTNEPSVKVAFDSVQGKTDVVVDSDTQPEIANGSDFAQHFTEHQKRSVSVRPHQCKICGFRFKQQSRLQRHINVHTRPYKCSFCNRKFPHEHLRKMHERSHKGTLPQCPVCGGRYVCLQKHMEVHNVDTVDTVKHVCSICKKGFKKEKGLKKHMLLHSRERPYSCQDCGKRFRTSTYLRTHCMGVHVNEKNHARRITCAMFVEKGSQ